eukprot:10942984-Alexandrium_andersonii.AAC.1
MEDRLRVHADLREHVRAVGGVHHCLAHPSQFSFSARQRREPRLDHAARVPADDDAGGGLAVLRVFCPVAVVRDVE